jgi:hypothetical protein
MKTKWFELPPSNTREKKMFGALEPFLRLDVPVDVNAKHSRDRKVF